MVVVAFVDPVVVVALVYPSYSLFSLGLDHVPFVVVVLVAILCVFVVAAFVNAVVIVVALVKVDTVTLGVVFDYSLSAPVVGPDVLVYKPSLV